VCFAAFVISSSHFIKTQFCQIFAEEEQEEEEDQQQNAVLQLAVQEKICKNNKNQQPKCSM
jgi:hypothetical protein